MLRGYNSVQIAAHPGSPPTRPSTLDCSWEMARRISFLPIRTGSRLGGSCPLCLSPNAFAQSHPDPAQHPVGRIHRPFMLAATSSTELSRKYRSTTISLCLADFPMHSFNFSDLLKSSLGLDSYSSANNSALIGKPKPFVFPAFLFRKSKIR